MSYQSKLRVLAIDPGPAWMGWASLLVQHGPGVRCNFVRGGHMPCGRVDFRRLLLSERLSARAEGCDLALAIETPAGYAFQPARVPMLLQTRGVATAMQWMAEEEGHRVAVCTAQQVRKVLGGKATADDEAVKLLARGHVFGAPQTGNDHVNDALCVGVVGAWSLVGQVVLPPVSDGTSKRRKLQSVEAGAVPAQRKKGAK